MQTDTAIFFSNIETIPGTPSKTPPIFNIYMAVHYARYFRQWILKSRNCLDIISQLYGRLPSYVSHAKTGQSVQENDHFYQNKNM